MKNFSPILSIISIMSFVIAFDCMTINVQSYRCHKHSSRKVHFSYYVKPYIAIYIFSINLPSLYCMSKREEKKWYKIYSVCWFIYHCFIDSSPATIHSSIFLTLLYLETTNCKISLIMMGKIQIFILIAFIGLEIVSSAVLSVDRVN